MQMLIWSFMQTCQDKTGKKNYRRFEIIRKGVALHLLTNADIHARSIFMPLIILSDKKSEKECT